MAKVSNAKIDRRPGLISRCTGTVAVVKAAHFATEHGILVSVRGGSGNFGIVTAFENQPFLAGRVLAMIKHQFDPANLLHRT